MLGLQACDSAVLAFCVYSYYNANLIDYSKLAVTASFFRKSPSQTSLTIPCQGAYNTSNEVLTCCTGGANLSQKENLTRPQLLCFSVVVLSSFPCNSKWDYITKPCGIKQLYLLKKIKSEFPCTKIKTHLHIYSVTFIW